MKCLFTTIMLSFTMLNSIAHPGIGLICDARNNIFYTDLENIWMIDTNGGRTIVVPDVHAHELVIDDQGNIYGEHYWYDEGSDVFKNYIWKLTPDLEVQIERDTLTGENQDFSFVRDRHFNGYFMKCVEKDCQILEMDNTGTEEVLYLGEFEDVRWKYMSDDGSLYFADLYSLYVLKPHQRPQMIIEDLHENRFPFSFLGSRHSVYGIWTDDENNIYSAIYGGRMVKRITSYWEVTPILKSNFLWSPVNGVFDKNNDLWIMESTLWGKIRVRKIDMDRLKSYNTMAFIVDYLVLGLIFFIAGFVLVKINRKRNARKAEKSAKSD